MSHQNNRNCFSFDLFNQDNSNKSKRYSFKSFLFPNKIQHKENLSTLSLPPLTMKKISKPLNQYKKISRWSNELHTSRSQPRIRITKPKLSRKIKFGSILKEKETYKENKKVRLHYLEIRGDLAFSNNYLFSLHSYRDSMGKTIVFKKKHQYYK